MIMPTRFRFFLLMALSCTFIGNAATTLQGTALFGADAIYKIALQDWSSSAQPQKIAGTDGIEWPRFSPDGKLIAGVNKNANKAYVMFNDGSGITEVASDLSFGHNEAKVVEWVKTIDGSYELGYPVNRGIKSVIIQVDWNAKNITKSSQRTIAQDIGTGRAGMNGGFDIVDMADGTRRVLLRARYMAEFHTQPNKDTPAQSCDQYSWPTQNNTEFYNQNSHNDMYPHSCFHSMSHDGNWVQLMQNVHNDEWPGQKGDHLGFVTIPWQAPKKLGDESELAALPWVLYNTPSSMGGTEVRNYRWTNNPKIMVAGSRGDGKFYVIELASYPPSATADKKGSATWTGFDSQKSNELWGCDLWVDNLPAPDPGNVRYSGIHQNNNRLIKTAITGNTLDIVVDKKITDITIFDLQGTVVHTFKTNGFNEISWKAPHTGMFILEYTGKSVSGRVPLTVY